MPEFFTAHRVIPGVRLFLARRPRKAAEAAWPNLFPQADSDFGVLPRPRTNSARQGQQIQFELDLIDG
jgi:hypothetical protein